MFRICNNKINNNIDNKLNLDIKMLYKKNELLNIKKFNSIFKNLINPSKKYTKSNYNILQNYNK